MGKKSVLHAVKWIAIYILLVNMGDMVSEQIGQPNLATGLILLLFSVYLWGNLNRKGWREYIGIKQITNKDLRKTLFYAPLGLLALFQFSKGMRTSITPGHLAMICLLMVGVGFLEEVIFRGFLYKAIEEKSGQTRAIIITGITFGLGHIVNLFRGYGYVEQLTQILAAAAIGIILALLVAITRNIVPGILFHILFNISGSITNEGSGNQALYGLLIILLMSAAYGFYLLKTLNDEPVMMNPDSRLVSAGSSKNQIQ